MLLIVSPARPCGCGLWCPWLCSHHVKMCWLHAGGRRSSFDPTAAAFVPDGDFICMDSQGDVLMLEDDFDLRE